ncbi:MAG TPA: pyridoxal-phosphate dependent enzyme [Myxococcales bacterium]|nr:pyridoxal-phosphate dependent enzyme [Myxococcales bacterium]
MFSRHDIEAARTVVRAHFPATPLIHAPRLSEKLGTDVWLKLDTVTPVRTFKIRGALAKLHQLELDGHEGGVVTASAGNHALAVAWAARAHRRPVVVCLPEQANPQKVALIEGTGAEIQRSGADFFDAYQLAKKLTAERGLAMVHPYDDPAVIKGQATLGLEILDTGLDCDSILVGVGGGGLLAGIACAVHLSGRPIRVLGAQPHGADSMVQSLEKGTLTSLEKVDTIADGLSARVPGEIALSIIRDFTGGVSRVSDEELLAAGRLLLAQERLVAEPAGLAGLALLMSMGSPRPKRPVVVVSGANISDAMFERMLG